MASPNRRRKPQTLAETLGSLTSQAVEKVLQEVLQCTGRPSVADRVDELVDVFLHGRVPRANIVMYDRTPMVRVVIRHKGKDYRVDKGRPLVSLLMPLCKELTAVHPIKDVADKILAILPEDEVALQVANIENASAEALQDEKKLAPIRERLNSRRIADKERLVARIREVFKDHDNLLTEDEVIQLWREGLVREIMDA
jgi:hypothetical protein